MDGGLGRTHHEVKEIELSGMRQDEVIHDVVRTEVTILRFFIHGATAYYA